MNLKHLRILNHVQILALDELLFKADKPVIIYPNGNIKDCGDSNCNYLQCESGMLNLMNEDENDGELYTF